MSRDVRIRSARPEEAGALTALALRAKASWNYPAAWLARWEAELAFDPAYISAHRVRVAEAGDVLAGVLALEERPDGWEIERLWVDPAAQGLGAGRALVDDAVAHAARERRGDVTVLSDPHAEAFYRRLGATRIGDVPAPMPGAPDRVLPRLVLRL